MKRIEDLAGQLGAERALARVGTFELDPERARAKLQRFQLQDPHHYVLELIQAAHLLGATEIHITQDADEFDLRCDAGPLEARQRTGSRSTRTTSRVGRCGRARSWTRSG